MCGHDRGARLLRDRLLRRGPGGRDPALKLGKVDLYGDSDRTFFSQHFIALHPELLHSVVLDCAYSAHALDPWYASSGTAARAAMEKVAPGSVARLAQLLASGRFDARLLAGIPVFAVWTPGMDEVTAKIRGAVLTVPSPL